MAADFETRLLERLVTAPGDDVIAANQQSAVTTAAGPARPDNQDRALLARFADGAEVAAVADGMGGMRDGGGCAAQGLAAFAGWLADRGASPDAAALHYANARVFERCRGAGGTTLTAVVVPPGGTPWLAHAGDSRVYGLSVDEAPRQRSRDHNALAEFDDHGQTLSAAYRMRLGAQITCAVGLRDFLELPPESLPETPFLLTTDGVHDFAAGALAGPGIGHGEAGAALARLLEAARAGASYDDATALRFVPGSLRGDDGSITVWMPGEVDAPWRW